MTQGSRAALNCHAGVTLGLESHASVTKANVTKANVTKTNVTKTNVTKTNVTKTNVTVTKRGDRGGSYRSARW